MRHLTAVQLETGWHYASVGRHGGGPIGNCIDHAPHPTEAEARECYAAYRRSKVTLDLKSSHWADCDVCGVPTKTGADACDGYGFVMLCAEHLTMEHAIETLGLNRPAGDSWQS